MVKIIESDIFDAPIDVVIHQTNCFTTMGSGIALALKNKFPEIYEADQATKRGDINKLGTYTTIGVKHERIKYVVNLYSQYRYGLGSRHTNYEAMSRGLEDIRDSLVKNKAEHFVLGFPYMIGCALGGGNIRIVQTIIEETFKDYKGDVLICKKP